MFSYEIRKGLNMKKQRLTIENRILIEELVKLKYKLKHIAEIIEVDKSTISRELKKRRITGKGNYKECKLTTRFPYVCNGCDNRIKCRKKNIITIMIKRKNIMIIY